MPEPPARSSIGIAIIGCGSMGAIHAASLADTPGATLRAFCDTDHAAADRLSRPVPGSYATTEPARVLRDPEIDAVYICTRNDSHAALGIAAAQAGKHVMMEKPIALTLRECDDLVRVVDWSGVSFMTAFKLRFSPAVQKIREFLPTPRLCVAQMMDERWPDEFWGNDPESGGGNVLSQGCHTVDLCSYLLRSEPVEVYAAGGNFHHPGLAIVDQALMILRFANGSLASIVQGDLGATPFVSKMSFQIMDGVRTAHLHDRLKKAVMWDGSSLQTHSDAEEYGVAHENHEFVESLRSGRRPSSTLHDGVRATVVLLRALDSLRTGKPEAIFW